MAQTFATFVTFLSTFAVHRMRKQSEQNNNNDNKKMFCPSKLKKAQNKMCQCLANSFKGGLSDVKQLNFETLQFSLQIKKS